MEITGIQEKVESELAPEGNEECRQGLLRGLKVAK